MLIVGVLNDTVNKFVQVVSGFEAIVTANENNAFTAPQFNDRAPEVVQITTLDVQSMVLEMPQFIATMDGLQKQLSTGVQAAVRYTRYLEQFKAMYYEAIHADPSALIDPTGDLTPFYKAIQKYRKQQGYYDALDIELHTGMLMVQIEAVTSLFSPAPAHCIDQIHTLLPALANGANQTLAAEVENGVRSLTSISHNVAEHVEWLKLLDDTYTSLEGLEDRYEQVRELYDLIDEENIQIDPQQMAEFQSTRPSIEHLKNVIDSGDSERDAKTKKFSEQLQDDVQELKERAQEIKNKSYDPLLADAEAVPQQSLEMVTDLHESIKALLETGKQYTEWQMLFALNPPAEYEEMEETILEIGMKRRLWQSIVDIQTSSGEWFESFFKDVDANAMEQAVAQYGKVAYQVQKALPKNQAIAVLRDEVERWNKVLPVLGYLTNEALLQCHWEELQKVTQIDLYDTFSNEKFTVEMLVELELHPFTEDIERISVFATQESILEEQLLKVQTTWEGVEFIPLDHKPEVYKEVYILGGVDDVYTALEETQMVITTVLGSRFVARLRERVDEWERKLRRLSDTVDAWVDCQCQWMYLEAIFTSPDIMSKLPAESKMFAGIDKSWKETMRKVKHNPLAINIATRPGLLEMFQKHNEQLDVIQKNLEKYLEQKRVLFPR